MSFPKSLIKILNKLKSEHVNARIEGSTIKFNVDLQKTNFLKISLFLYLILNKFENPYLIFINGIPFCLMPDAENHLIYNKKNGVEYQKDSVCQKCKYYRICPGWISGNLLNKRPAPVSHLPREIVFEVTNQCNLNCPICFSGKGSKELSFNRIKVLIDECAQLGIKNVRFTGGEPILYANMVDALHYAKNKHLYITVNTNATMINKKMTLALQHYVDDILISFQGFNSASEKKLTGCTADLKEKIHNIIQLKSRIAVVRLGTIITPILLNNFEKYFYLIKSLKVKNWELYRPMPAIKSEDSRVPSKDLLRLMTAIKLKKLNGADIMIANPIPFCITKDRNLSHHVLTGAEFDDGHSRLVVDVQGFLKPSYLIPKNLGSTIKEARRHPFLKKMQSLDFLPKECQNCFSLRWCKGGSRHCAKISHDSYFDCDPLMKSHTKIQL